MCIRDSSKGKSKSTDTELAINHFMNLLPEEMEIDSDNDDDNEIDSEEGDSDVDIVAEERTCCILYL